MRERKSFASKATVQDETQGIVHCVVSVFGTSAAEKDSDGDVVVKGAFDRTLKDRKDAGRALPPGVWAHDWNRPIAKTLEAYEGADGLHVVGQCNLETQDGRDAFSNIKLGLFSEYSFGFEVKDSERKDGARFLKDLELYEWSPVLVGADRRTGTVAVKEHKSTLRSLLLKAMDAAEVLDDDVQAGMLNAAIGSLRWQVDLALSRCVNSPDGDEEPDEDDFSPYGPQGCGDYYGPCCAPFPSTYGTMTRDEKIKFVTDLLERERLLILGALGAFLDLDDQMDAAKAFRQAWQRKSGRGRAGITHAAIQELHDAAKQASDYAQKAHGYAKAMLETKPVEEDGKQASPAETKSDEANERRAQALIRQHSLRRQSMNLIGVK